MAEPSDTTPVEVAGSEQTALLATKLHVPQLPPGYVSRPRLVGRLDEALARGLILVSAPPGFGKTATLADWARRSERPVAWLSLDADDNDPTRFWRHAIAALGRVCPGIGEQFAPLLGPPAPPSFEGLVTVLINELAVSPSGEDTLLVLDDYHLIDSRAVHTSLAFLLEHLPPRLRLVMATRSDPPLALPRWRARGLLAEVRAADLRFTADEAAVLLRDTVGSDLPDTVSAALATRTEGWVAGLQLAALSLQGRADVAGFVESFSGSHRYVLDYLTEEVLERQPEPVRGFLLETSVLDRLSGQLCDAVAGRTDSQLLLEAIERANLFLVPLDEVRGWWRYHRLFADLLRERLQREQPERVLELHGKAAAWFEEHDLPADAIRHALAAKNPASAARLIERHADALLMHSEGVTLQRWLEALPPELAGTRPRLLLAQTRLALLGGRVELVGAQLDAAEHAFANGVDEPYEPSIGRGASLLANVPATIALDRAYLAALGGDAERAVRFASQAVTQIDEHEWMLKSHATGYRGVAELLRGHLAEAESAVSSSIAQWQMAGERYLAVRGCHHLGQIQRAQGRLDAALGTYRQALELSTRGRSTLPVAGIAYVGMAEVAYQRGELDNALRHITDGLAPCRLLAYTQPLATGLATLAWIRRAQGDPSGALDAIAEAERVAPGPATSLLNPVPVHGARLRLLQGDISAAIRWTQQYGLDADDEPTHVREAEHLVLARVLLATEAPDRASRLLDGLHTAALVQGRTGSVIEIQALRSLALAAAGDDTAAVSALANALALACPQGYVRVFADEGRPMGALLARMVAAERTQPAAVHSVPVDYLARLLGAIDPDRSVQHPAPGTATALPGIVEPLTARELEVLGLLAVGRSNRHIADELVVTLDTVKKHVGRVLDKLGATNRTEAVARARARGLVP